MARSALKRLADPSFPPELRLEVMKAGVPFGTTWWYIAPGKTMKDLRNAAYHSLLPLVSDQSHIHDSAVDQQTYSIIKDAAEQAFLGNVIFNIQLHWSMTMHNETSSVVDSMLLRSIGAHMHYLDMSAHVTARRGYRPGTSSSLPCLRIIRSMGSIKHHFPNLKVCILTLDVRASETYISELLERFNQQLLQPEGTAKARNERTQAVIEGADLFEAFAKRGPGKSQFVRIRCIRGILWEERHERVAEPFHYGPLVKVDSTEITEAEAQIKSVGRRLLEDAYRIVRTGPRLVKEEYPA